MRDLAWTWILNQTINRRGYRAEAGTRPIIALGASIVLVSAILIGLLVWALWPMTPRVNPA